MKQKPAEVVPHREKAFVRTWMLISGYVVVVTGVYGTFCWNKVTKIRPQGAGFRILKQKQIVRPYIKQSTVQETTGHYLRNLRIGASIEGISINI